MERVEIGATKCGDAEFARYRAIDDAIWVGTGPVSGWGHVDGDVPAFDLERLSEFGRYLLSAEWPADEVQGNESRDEPDVSECVVGHHRHGWSQWPGWHLDEFAG